MLSKHDDSLSFIKIKNNKKHTASAKIINPKNLNRRTLSKFPRTSSAINLPGLHFDPNDSLSSFYSTGFTFKSKISKNNANNMNKTLSHLLNINSIEDFIGKDKDPLEKQKQLYEEMREEKIKIKKILSNLISWDNEPTIKELDSMKLMKLSKKNIKKDVLKINLNKNNKDIKISKTMNDITSHNIGTVNNKFENNFTKIEKIPLIKEKEKNKIIKEGLGAIKGNIPMLFMKEMNKSKATEIKEKKMKLIELKFSVFDKDYDPKKYKPIIKKEKDLKKEEDEKINKYHQKNNLAQFLKEQRKIEMTKREESSFIYKNIIINKLKKKKFTEVLDDTYKLLDRARTEYALSVDILKERIKAVQKYYNAYIIAVDKISDNKKGNNKSQSNISVENDSEHSKRNKVKMSGMDIYEEKIKRYREYLLIMEDLNKEIKNYDDKFILIQDELNCLLKTSYGRINQLSIESKKLKYIFKELNNQQTQYYLDILKKGSDTRTEGLSWVIKRLMELNVQIDNSMFPAYLDQEQIDYIIQISKLGFESVQLKQILDSLRESQNNVKLKERHFLGFEDKETKKYEEKIKHIEFFNSDINNIEELLKEYDDCKTFKSLNKLKSIVHLDSNNNMHKNDFKNKVLKNYLEDIFIKSIIKNIKKKITIDSNFQKVEKKEKNKNRNLINYLLAKDENKDYYKDVIILSERIQKLHDFIKKMRKEEFEIFEEKFKYGIKNTKTKKFYDKVFNALFGSASFEFSDFQKMNLLED